MSKKTIGNIEIEVWQGGHPVWCHISGRGCAFHHDPNRVMLKLDHTDLDDLEYAVKALKRMAADALPDSHRHEVTGWMPVNDKNTIDK